MPDNGKTNIVVMWTAAPDDVAEGDRIFQSHAGWMTGHSREGDTALLSYRISKGPELANPVDPTSEPTGNTIFVLNEIYESPAGVASTGGWRPSPGRTCPRSWTGASSATRRRCTAEASSKASGSGGRDRGGTTPSRRPRQLRGLRRNVCLSRPKLLDEQPGWPAVSLNAR